MANTYVDYTATASQTDFAFSFPYLEDEHVTVEIDGTLTTNFTIVTSPATKVVLNTGATAGQIVRVRRQSQPDTNLVDFENGSVLTESELDRAYLHNRYLAEEISELNDASLQKEQGGTGWDVKDEILKNVADAVEASDAANKSYVDAQVYSALTGTGLVPSFNKFTGDGVEQNFSLTFTTNGIASSAVLVTIDGAVQDPDDYTIAGGSDEIQFSTPPPLNTEILVIERGYKTKTEIPNEYDWGSVVGDTAIATYTYGKII